MLFRNACFQLLVVFPQVLLVSMLTCPLRTFSAHAPLVQIGRWFLRILVSLTCNVLHCTAVL